MCEKSGENRKNFTSIRKQFLRHLSATANVTEISHRFGALVSNLERVNFVEELLKSAKIGAELQSDNKSDEIAVKLREQGNEMFKVKKLKEAWEFYTKSAAHAEEGGANLGLAYANRSAVLFEADLHKQCLMDINRALDHNYPEHLKSKLFVRRKNSKNLEVEASGEPHEEVPTVDTKNPKVQSASDCLEIREDENFGRFVAASRDIKCGEILAVENPFALLLVSQLLSHCHECISLCYNLIPCKTCTQALYCSEDCRGRAFDRYHKHECPILATINYLELDIFKVLPLKIAFLARNEDFSDYLNSSGEMYRSDSYREIHNLIANTSKRSVSDLFERATAAVLIFDLVKNHTNFFDSEKQEARFKEVLLLHMQTGPSNFHEITELAPNSSGVREFEEIAGGAFAFLSLLNHSCCPNVTRFCYGSSIVLRAIENIKEGEQCFDNYGYHHALMRQSERQKKLQDQYYFQCVCQACEKNYPLYQELPELSSGVDNIELDDTRMSKLSSGDVKTAEDVLPEMLTKLSVLQEMQPCRDFCQVQEIVKQCFAVFGNKRSVF